mmetsp:Transcript_63664/g.87505  ORF Transcript_63664/g.87505 Transcript_63664/m.87505 type:complete len:207 (+) Transcript_63664:233-853(+)
MLSSRCFARSSSDPSPDSNPSLSSSLPSESVSFLVRSYNAVLLSASACLWNMALHCFLYSAYWCGMDTLFVRVKRSMSPARPTRLAWLESSLIILVRSHLLRFATVCAGTPKFWRMFAVSFMLSFLRSRFVCASPSLFSSRCFSFMACFAVLFLVASMGRRKKLKPSPLPEGSPNPPRRSMPYASCLKWTVTNSLDMCHAASWSSS